MKKTICVYRSGFAVEVACTRRGRPSYRWATGWAEVDARGYHSNVLPLRELQRIGKRDGFRVRRFACAADAQVEANRLASVQP